MRKVLLFALMTTLITAAKAQIPQQLNYQGIARNSTGVPITYQNISVRISILDSAAGGQTSYRETRKVMTNYVGLFNILIGSPGATNVSGSIQNVNWPTGQKYIKLEIDPKGASNFIVAGITQLQSVPYALSAATSGTAGGDLTGTYPSPDIANNAVTTNKIADGSVSLPKLAPAVITALDNKLNIADTASMLLHYATKASIAGEDLTKLNISDTAAMLSQYATKASIPGEDLTKLNISDTAAMLSQYYASATAVSQFAGVNSSISDEAARATAAENLLAVEKEDVANKSTDGTFAAASDMKYPTEKATKTYIDTQISTAATTDATSAATGKIQLAGDLAGTGSTATSPVISDNAITTNKIADDNITDAKIASVSGAKITGDISGNAAGVTGIVPIANGGTGSSTQTFIDLSSDQLIGGLKSFASPVSIDGSVTGSSFIRSGGTSEQYLMADGSVSTASFSGSGTTNFLSKFTGTTSFSSSSVFDNGTSVGIGTDNPSSRFQINGEGNTDLNLKFDTETNTSAALKIGYRQYQWRMKTNANSGELQSLVFSYFNGSTDAARLLITNSGLSVPDNLDVTGNVSAAKAAFAGLDVNNGQLSVDKVNNRIGLFTVNPNSLFQIGGEANTDLNLKYDFDPNNSSALKFGYRQYQWRIKTSTNSGVLLPLVFSYFNGTSDVDILQVNMTGGIIADSYAKPGGTSSQFLKADGSIDDNVYLTSAAASTYLSLEGGTLTGTLSGTSATLSGTLTAGAVTYPNTDGTGGQVLATNGNGTISWTNVAVREVADEFTASIAQSDFTLTQTPSPNSKVKMYINGIRISNAAYHVSGNTLSYNAANNGTYILAAADRIQFDYFY